jgi:uncharacterized protein (DUF1697 family)
MPRSAKEQGRLQTSIALLRGINVGGKKKVSMGDLRALFDELEAEDVRTHLQSGNVVFKSVLRDTELIDRVEKAIARELGLKVTVVVRTKAQLAKVVANNPFAEKVKEQAKLHVAFLAAAPARDSVRGLDPTYGAPDEFRLAGREIYLYYPNGYGRTKINNAYFERKLGVAATTRNWNTVTKLAELANA